MGERIPYQVPRSERREEEPVTDEETTVATNASVERKETLNDIDALLDTIDLVLEENPEQFVEQYQQRGGE